MAIFSTVLPILMIVLVGYLAANRQFLSENDCNSIAKLVFNFLIPVLLFIGTVKAEIPEQMEWEFLIAFYAPLLFIYLLGLFLGKWLFNYANAEQSVFSMGCSYSNSTIIGIPVCLYALGEKAMLPLFIILSVHNLFLFTLGCFAAERNLLFTRTFVKDIWAVIKQLVTSPITASLLLGAVFNLLQLPIYAPIKEALLLTSQAGVPMALFVLGASLNKYKIHGNITPALVIVICKTVLSPLLVWFLIFEVFSVDPIWAATALLTSAMPVGISAYIFSQQYQVGEAAITTSILISTLVSIFTLSFLIGYLQLVS